MKYILIVLLIVVASNLTFSQSNTVYLEVGGRSYGYALTYDKLISKLRNSNIGFSVGFGVIPTTRVQSWTLPTSFNFITNAEKNHHLELGIGLTYHLMRDESLGGPLNDLYTWENKHLLYLNSTFGYRYQRPNGGFFFKANVNLIAGLYGAVDIDGKAKKSENYSGWFKSTWLYPSPIMPWCGFGLGYSF